MSAATSPRTLETDEIGWAREFITRVVAECPRRTSTGDDERRAQLLVRDELEALGLATEVKPFRWNKSLYANLALHFGVATLGSAIAGRAPGLAFGLHALSALSYAADSTRAAFLLRRLFPFRDSQNVLGILRAKKPQRLRVVFLAHADAAYTGWIFHPAVASRLTAKPESPFYKSMRITTGATLGLAAIDLLQMYFGRSWPLRIARLGLTVPAAVGLLANLQIVLRNTTVPGAMDDLSGIAGMILLARRLLSRAPEDVEIVFCATGCEESGLGGSQRLLEQMRGEWSPERTVIIGLDGLANGELRHFLEGEIVRVPLQPWLADALRGVGVPPFEIPVGGTDALPWAAAGYPAVTLGCVDPRRGMPREYHLPSDTPENLEVEMIPDCVDAAERLFDAVVQRRG